MTFGAGSVAVSPGVGRRPKTTTRPASNVPKSLAFLLGQVFAHYGDCVEVDLHMKQQALALCIAIIPSALSIKHLAQLPTQPAANLLPGPTSRHLPGIPGVRTPQSRPRATRTRECVVPRLFRRQALKASRRISQQDAVRLWTTLVIALRFPGDRIFGTHRCSSCFPTDHGASSRLRRRTP